MGVRQLLFSVYPKLLLPLLVAAAAKGIAELRRGKPHVAVRARLVLAGVLLLGAALRFGREARHEVFYDEYEHADIARNFARSGSFARTIAGGRPDLGIYELPTWPGAFHVAAGALSKVTLDPEAAGFLLNRLAGSLTPLLLFALGALAFSEGAGLAAAALWALWPDHVRLSAAGDLSVFASFWLAASLAAAAWLDRKRDADSAWLLALCAGCAVNCRFENAALLPFAGLLLIRDRRWGPLALLAACLLPPASLYRLNGDVGLAGFALDNGGPALSRIPGNLLANLKLARVEWLVLPVLAALAPGGHRRAAAALGLTSAVFLLGICAFYRGVMDGPQARYSLAVLLPLLPAAGAGLAVLAGQNGYWIAAALGLALRPWAPGLDTENHAADRFLRSLTIQSAKLVVGMNAPAVIVTTGKPAVQPRQLSEQAVMERTGNGMLLLDDWAWREKSGDYARLFRDHFAWTTLAEGGDPRKPVRLIELTPLNRK